MFSGPAPGGVVAGEARLNAESAKMQWARFNHSSALMNTIFSPEKLLGQEIRPCRIYDLCPVIHPCKDLGHHYPQCGRVARAG
jgi:hypothetical protein